MEKQSIVELAAEWQQFDGTWTEFLKAKSLRKNHSKRKHEYLHDYNTRNRELLNAKQRERYRRKMAGHRYVRGPYRKKAESKRAAEPIVLAGVT